MVDVESMPLTPAQAAQRLGVTPGRVRQLFATGELPYRWTPLGRLVEPEAVRLLIEKRASRLQQPNRG